MSFDDDKPSQEFLEKLAAFQPYYSAVQCAKEMADFLVILTAAPLLVRNGMDGFLRGTYMDKLTVFTLRDMDENITPAPVPQSSSK